jgi:uncharacterized protein YacL
MLRPIILARILFVLLATACGYWITYDTTNTGQALNTAITCGLMALVIIVFEYSMRTVSPKRVFFASLGLLFGLLVSSMVYQTIPANVMTPNNARILCNFLFGYLGMMVALKHADQLNLTGLKFMLPNQTAGQARLLDTSVIIDGRIKELILNNFISGPIMVPTLSSTSCRCWPTAATRSSAPRGAAASTSSSPCRPTTPTCRSTRRTTPPSATSTASSSKWPRK